MQDFSVEGSTKCLEARFSGSQDKIFQMDEAIKIEIILQRFAFSLLKWNIFEKI